MKTPKTVCEILYDQYMSHTYEELLVKYNIDYVPLKASFLMVLNLKKAEYRQNRIDDILNDEKQYTEFKQDFVITKNSFGTKTKTGITRINISWGKAKIK